MSEEKNKTQELREKLLCDTKGFKALSADDIMHELSFKGFHGREYNANSIGKSMKRLGFESKTIRGVKKYLIAKVDYDQHNRENKEDSKLFVPEIF